MSFATRSSSRSRRTRTIDIIATLTDADEYTREDIAELYGFRWNSELDIRAIKSSLNLGTCAASRQRWWNASCGRPSWETI